VKQLKAWTKKKLTNSSGQTPILKIIGCRFNRAESRGSTENCIVRFNTWAKQRSKEISQVMKHSKKSPTKNLSMLATKAASADS